jgi:hypothetical protein
MKKYILVVFGDFQNQESCKEIALSITPLVDSPHLKFNYTKGCLIFHFASEVMQNEIHDYLVGTLFDITNAFILTEFTDNVSVHLPQDIAKHLLDLDNNDEDDTQIKIDLTEAKKTFESDEDDDFVALLLEEVKNKVKKPSLDQILDKINSTGFDSLSPFEKDVLKNYSNH